jgi:lipopolysaccharide export system permease protein
MPSRPANERRTGDLATPEAIVGWSILHRMIFLELLRVFLLSLLTLTGLLLMAGIVAEASQRGLPPNQVLSVIPLLIPSTLPYTIPATTLFAVCIVYGRLSADNEVLALKAAGVNMLHVIWPAVLLGLIASGTTFAMYMDTIPSTHHALRTRFLEDVEEFLYTVLKREGCIRHSKLNYEIHVKRVEDRKLIDVQFMRRDPRGKGFDIIARAREAELIVDKKNNQILVHMKHCYINSESGREPNPNVAYARDRYWPMDLPEEFKKPTKGSGREMTWLELFDHLERLQQERDKFSADLLAHQAVINQGTAPPHFQEHVRQLAYYHKVRGEQIRSIETEFQMRPALSLGCLCFVLIGCPVGIWFSRADYLSAFITCFLPIVLIYYPLLLCGINLAKAGAVDPVVALWSANGLMAVIALFLFRRLMRN